MNATHHIEVSSAQPGGFKFVNWLWNQGHSAQLVRHDEGSSVDGISIAENDAASAVFNSLWDDFCAS